MEEVPHRSKVFENEEEPVYFVCQNILRRWKQGGTKKGEKKAI